MKSDEGRSIQLNQLHYLHNDIKFMFDLMLAFCYFVFILENFTRTLFIQVIV